MKKIIIKNEFKDDYISRAAGEKLRLMIEDCVSQNKSIELDFTDVTIASTSFFDEGIAKLALNGWDSKRLHQFIKFKNLNPRDFKVMDKMCQYRDLGPLI